MAAVAGQPIICLFADLQILPRVQLLLQTFHSFNLLYNSYGTINVSNTLQLYRGSQLSWHCPALSACLPDPAQQIVSESWPRIWFYLVNLAVMVLYFPASTGWCDNNKPSRTQPQQLCSILNSKYQKNGLRRFSVTRGGGFPWWRWRNQFCWCKQVVPAGISGPADGSSHIPAGSAPTAGRVETAGRTRVVLSSQSSVLSPQSWDILDY